MIPVRYFLKELRGEDRAFRNSSYSSEASVYHFGSVLVVLALASNLIRLSIGEEFSWNQMAIVLAGVVLILGGIAGRRFPVLYKGFALLLLNTAVVLILIDLASLFIIKLWHPEHLQILERKVEAGLEDPGLESDLQHPLLQLFLNLNISTLLSLHDLSNSENSIGNQPEVVNYLSYGADADSLSFEVTCIMFENYDFIEQLSEQYDFDVLFFIQPSV